MSGENNEEPTFTVYLQWVYEEGLTFQQAKARSEWLNLYMYVPGFSYHIDGQVEGQAIPEREQILPPTDPVEGEPLYPFYTPGDPLPEVDPVPQVYLKQEGTKLVWPPETDNPEDLYRWTFESLDKMGEEEEIWTEKDEIYKQFLQDGLDFQ